MIIVTANFNLHTYSFENFSINVVYKQCFIEEVTFLESAEKQNIDVFFFIPTMKTAVIEFLLSVNIPTIFEMEYVWTKEETFVTLFLLLHHATLLAQKSNCFEFIFKGDKPSN